MSDMLQGRKEARTDFAYPVEFKLHSPNLLSRNFSGYIRDLSIRGACIKFDDVYGRFKRVELKGSKIQLAIKLSQGKCISLMASISWVRKDFHHDEKAVLIGIEFADVSESQLEELDKFFSLKDKDQSMMWNLCDYYIENKPK